MSYCVQCGVELDDSAKKCALCSTPVINPNKPAPEESPTPFAEEAYIPKEIKTRFVAGIVTLVMLIPNIVCFCLNAVLFPDSFWSLYVISASLLIWVVFVVPFFMKKNRAYFMWAFDTAAVLLYNYTLFLMLGRGGWFYDCALPIVLFNSVLVLLYLVWVKRKKRHSILKALFVFSDLALSFLISGLMLSVGGGVPYAAEIGIIVFSCIIAVLIFLAICYRSKAVRRWLSKRLFV